MTTSSSSYRKRVYTKFGDSGETSLLYGGRVSKNNLHTEAYGITDEAVSAMGLARATSEDLRVKDVLRDLQNVGMPVPFNLLAVILGMIGHVMNGAIFAIVFAFLIASRIGSRIGRSFAGAGYGALVFLLTWFVILPLIDPVMLNLNAGVFFIGHIIWGIALGALGYWAAAKA